MAKPEVESKQEGTQKVPEHLKPVISTAEIVDLNNPQNADEYLLVLAMKLKPGQGISATVNKDGITEYVIIDLQP